MEQMVDHSRQSGSLADMRLTTACLVAFAGFLRFSEIIEPNTIDISLRADAMVIKISHSKSDLLRKGDEVIIARNGKATCTVTYLENFLRRSGTSLQEQRIVFHPICKFKAGERLREPGSISYTFLWEHFKKRSASLDTTLQLLACTVCELVVQLKRPTQEFQIDCSNVMDNGSPRMSRMDGYIDDSVEHRLSVTRQLGL